MEQYEYAGPRIPRTPRTEKMVRHRIDEHIEEVVERRYREAREDWAKANEGRFPSEADIRVEAISELAILCEALDGWAAVAPYEFFPQVAQEFELPEWPG